MAKNKHISWLLKGRAYWNEKRDKHDFEPYFSKLDLYTKFSRNGKLNSEGNIDLAGFNLNRADFSGAFLSTPFSTGSVDLTGASLWHANLHDAHLTNAKLDDAVLIGANLEGADLSDASLISASLASANLRKATLFEANLENVRLDQANLADAYLGSAKLKNANLSSAGLIGTDLSCSRPWESKLFTPERIEHIPLLFENLSPIKSVSDLIRTCSILGSQYLHNRKFFFRGESQNNWELRPTLMREEGGDFPFRSNEGEMLLELISRRPEDFDTANSALSHWVLAQHHGLPTRLLDITRNPLVALSGACGDLGEESESFDCDGRLHVFLVPTQTIKPFNSDAVSVVANLAKLRRSEQDYLLGIDIEDYFALPPDYQIQYEVDSIMRRLYHLIKQEKPHFSERIDPRDFYRVFVVEPLQSFERIRAQSGAFLISGFHERFERDEILKWNPDIPIYDHIMLDVPRESKLDIVKELQLLNVKRESLFPGLDEAAKAINRRYAV